MSDIKRALNFCIDESITEFVEGYEPRRNFYIQSQIALEKQIPKKPIDQSDYADTRIGSCPLCKNYVDNELNKHYCNNKACGQALKWEIADEGK